MMVFVFALIAIERLARKGRRFDSPDRAHIKPSPATHGLAGDGRAHMLLLSLAGRAWFCLFPRWCF